MTIDRMHCTQSIVYLEVNMKSRVAGATPSWGFWVEPEPELFIVRLRLLLHCKYVEYEYEDKE